MPAIDHPLIDRFLESLWLEKGLSVHTRAAYRSDLALFNGWLQARDVQLADAGRELILDHLAWRLNEGYKARSTARLLSGLRGFYRFLLREQSISRDPTLQVELPQLGRPLPKSLSEADVEALLAAPELDDPIGLRDRANQSDHPTQERLIKPRHRPRTVTSAGVAPVAATLPAGSDHG